MRTRVAALFTVLTAVAAFAVTVSVPAGAQLVTDQPFGGYGSGATVSANVLALGQTQALNIQAAAAGQSTNSKGLPAAGLNNEMGYIVQPPGISDRLAYGRGTGLELGALTQPSVDPNQILLSGLAQQAAPPNEPVPDVKEIGPIQLGGVAFASLLQGRARALFDPNICVIGRPFSFGEGSAAGLQILGTPTGANTPFSTALVQTAQPAGLNNPNNTSRTRSVTYLRPNGDGTYAVVSETRQHIAPVQLIATNLAPATATVELLGEWALRAIATGKPGGAKVEYAPVGAGPTTAVLRVTLGGGTPTEITLQQIVGQNGLPVDLGPLLQAFLGVPPHALGGAPTSSPQLAPDGTSASAAVDVLKLTVLGIPNVLTGADIRLGHMEAAAVAPPGGVRCNVPVDKIGTPDPVRAGENFTITIRIPSSTDIFRTLFGCDLLNIRVVDVHEVESGNPTFELLSASNGGQISADGTTVTWDNIGNYNIGDPPIELTITGRIPQSSPAGVLKDTATVTATLGNCDGGGGDVTGVDIVGQGISGGGVTGVFTLTGPDVTRQGVLASTGGDERLLILGGVVLLGALGLRRRLRRPTPSTT